MKNSGAGFSRSKLPVVRPRFSWDTLPVFFHSQSTKKWSDAQAMAIARYPLATIEKGHNFNWNAEASIPEACRQIRAASGGNTTVLYYLNSIINWWHYKMHEKLKTKPQWRLKFKTGEDLRMFDKKDGEWAFNLAKQGLRQTWNTNCLNAVDAGCNGCWIDRANDMTQLSQKQRLSPQQSAQLSRSHMKLLNEIDAKVASKGGLNVLNNQMSLTRLPHMTGMMFEDWKGSEFCIKRLQAAVKRGLLVQARAGKQTNCANDGDVNAMAAFLIAAGSYSYYHCSQGWQSNADWPKVRDEWLDWLPAYDRKLGRPLGPGKKKNGWWTRKFASGTDVSFKASKNLGVIKWKDGPTVRGKAQTLRPSGCNWATF